MPAIRGVTASVGYGDVLAITLVRNMRHMTECVVITSPEDERTQEVARSVPGVRLSITDAFTRHGARFNKGLAFEEAGFDVLGRHGWILIHDADVLLPDSVPWDQLRPGHLHGARRRVLADPGLWTPGLDWNACPKHPDGASPIGFFQAFAAEDPALAGKRPWYDVSFAHAGGGDAYHMEHWHPTKRAMLPVEVLHLGVPDRQWFGTSDEAKDLMARYVTENEWRRAMRGLDPAAAQRAGELPGRVQVPGYEPSTYQLPFERRAQAKR